MSTLIEYKCPCCGGAIEFNSSEQQMKCPYCDNTFEMETLKAYDEQMNEQLEDKTDWDSTSDTYWSENEQAGMKSYSCQSCGAEIVADSTTAASSCPFCDSPIVVKGNVSGELRPDLIIPFKLNKEQAKEALSRHLNNKKLLPKIFKDQNHIDEIKGVYVPFWLFSTSLNAKLDYKAKKVRHWSDNKYDYDEISYYAVQRAGSMSFQNVPVDGSSKMEDDLMESIEPFDFNDATDFQTAYLAGYLADKYDVDSETSKERANERIKKSVELTFAEQVRDYTSFTLERENIRYEQSSVKYALCPVWILNTTWNDQKYTFAMNGQTGRFVGDLPMDKGAFWKYFGISFTIAAVISGIIGMFII